jgi:nucleoside phosphorylase
MNQVDVLVVTALAEEYQAARTAANGVTKWAEHDQDGFTPYLTGAYRTLTGASLTVALARPTRMGARSTSPISTTLTDRLKPTCLAMCGVCAGNPDDTAAGDVVVAARAYAYDEGSQLGLSFHGDHEQYPQDERWLRAAQDFDPSSLPSYGVATEREATIWLLECLHRGQDARKHPARRRYFPRGTWQPRLQKLEADRLIAWGANGWALTDAGTSMIRRILDADVDGPDRLPFAVLAGPMASGSAVIRDPDIWDRLKRMGNRRIIALEMEAATIATIAHGRQVPHWLVVKGVMDRADFDKDDRFKHFAARASAEVLFDLLGRLLSATSDVRRRPASIIPALTGETATPQVASVKDEVIRRLHYDWQDLADLFGVPSVYLHQLVTGDEPRGLWEWLENRGRLAELPGALDELGRADLADVMRRQES